MNKSIAKCRADEGFKPHLWVNSAPTLKAEGVELPAGLSITALENIEQVIHLVILMAYSCLLRIF